MLDQSSSLHEQEPIFAAPSAAVTANATRERLSEADKGPFYPAMGATVQKFRRMANNAGGVMALDWQVRQQYGEAVEHTILTLQRAQLNREVTLPRPQCASGTWHTTGHEIEEAIKRRQNNALLACPGKERRARTPNVWESMYQEAMADKKRRAEEAKKPAKKRGKK